jgi:hypothetical protein
MRDGGAVTRRLGGGRMVRFLCDERSEKLEISVGYRGVDGVDRGESIDGPVGPVTVLQRARSRASDFLRFRTYVL